jgi:anti-sigma factor RsiW
MACDTWREKIEAYADAELSPEEMRAMGEHLRGCASCTSDLLGCVQLKRAIKTAGTRYSPGVALRQRMQEGISKKNKPVWIRTWLPGLAATAAVVALAFLLFRPGSSTREGQTISELADLHVATMASATPVDVISTDRHTVKPWFQGKIPFTFNLPELADTPFTLEGGRVSYLDQAPGAQLIFKIGNHRVSVFIFQNMANRGFPSEDERSRHLTFNVDTWTDENLRYFVIGDADPNDIHRLSELLRMAARS